MKASDMKKEKKWAPEKSEEAMIQGIIEGSPEAIGVAVVRLNCGCRKMAAVDKEGEPASKVIMYRDRAESICDKCKEDNGSYMRITEQFIHWISPEPEAAKKKMIEEKVLGLKTH
jgi:sugar (pentulose or hexulose) kinase